jgi:hypothetical protein
MTDVKNPETLPEAITFFERVVRECLRVGDEHSLAALERAVEEGKFPPEIRLVLDRIRAQTH